MRLVDSPRVKHLPSQGARGSLTAGLVTLIVGVAVLVVAVTLPDPGTLTVKASASGATQAGADPFSASQPDLASMRTPVHGGRGNALDPVLTFRPAADIAATADNDKPIPNERPGLGSRGAFHAGDRSPIAVASRHDLRLDLMEMTPWGRRQSTAFPDS